LAESDVAVEAFPERAAVIVPAEKLPDPSRWTTALAVFEEVNVGFPETLAQGIAPEEIVPSVVMLVLPAQVESAVFSTLPSPTLLFETVSQEGSE